MDLYEAINHIAILEQASPATKAKILSCAHLKKVQEGEILFREREPVEMILFLVTGFAALYRHNHQGDRKIIFVYGSGEILNEVILENAIASISGQALSESYLLMISRNHFLELLDDAAFSRIVMCSEAKKIRRLYRQLANTTNMSRLEQQVAAKLWKLGRDFGEECEEGIRVQFELSITFLADMIGAKRESVSRTIKVLKEENLLEIEKGYFIIKDMELLLEKVYK